jgi:hypothetical protein
VLGIAAWRLVRVLSSAEMPPVVAVVGAVVNSDTTGHYGRLTTAAQKPSLVIEQATSSYSFRSLN